MRLYNAGQLGECVRRDDTQLIQACLNGDDAAWKELIVRYGRLVYSIPIRYGFSADDADEVFQNVFTIVFRQLRKLRQQAALTAWLITITHRESLRVARLARTHEELDDDVTDNATPPPDRIETWERQQVVREALSQIDLPCRDLLTALFLESPTPSYEKIATRFGISVGSVGPTRARCFKKLEAALISLGLEHSK